MTTDAERRLLPSYVGIFCVVAGLLAWLVPVFILPFANVLPYLQPMPFLQRLMWSALFFVAACALTRAAMTERQWAEVRNVAIRGWGSVIGVSLGLLMAIYASASISANTFGLLVKAFPAEQFGEELVVTSAKRVGSKHKALELELRSTQSKESYELVLSQRMFSTLPPLKPGDVIRIEGKRNLFGSYVHGFSVLPAAS